MKVETIKTIQKERKSAHTTIIVSLILGFLCFILIFILKNTKYNVIVLLTGLIMSWGVAIIERIDMRYWDTKELILTTHTNKPKGKK